MRTFCDLRWALREVALERGIIKTTDLWRALNDYGMKLPIPKVYLLMADTPNRLSLRVVAAQSAAVNCTPDELLVRSEGTRPTEPRLRALTRTLPTRGPRRAPATVIVTGPRQVATRSGLWTCGRGAPLIQ
ncbi:helix-turn-helix domain-containing protein [Nocardioides aquiterrae]|uniref:HTH cro/C1-type domain-containing protein n=1 Tax=Nocardioides aquiterrae TaxID=203799 RepID=A0ABP4EW22_9ACTN